MFFHFSLSVTTANYIHKTSRCYYTSICTTMSKAPPSDYPRNSSSKRGAKEKPLDPNDPNDSAFVLVSVDDVIFSDFFVEYFFSPLSSSLSTPQQDCRHHRTPQQDCLRHRTPHQDRRSVLSQDSKRRRISPTINAITARRKNIFATNARCNKIVN